MRWPNRSLRTILALVILICQPALAQVGGDGLKLNLKEDGSLYLKVTFLNQVWVRYDHSNPGTLVLGQPAEHTFDIGLRRTRIQFFGQVTDHVFFYTQFGQNNFNFLSQNSGNRKLQVFFHDALGEYKVWRSNNRLKMGAGLTIANGLSRFSQPSIGTIMTMDVPIFAQATVDQTDEFSRKLSIYARGQLGKLDYRLILSDPFPVTSNGQSLPAIQPNSTFSQVGHHYQYQGLFIYNLLEAESHVTPYMTGTYLGKKKVFNIEAGFIQQRNAMWQRESPAADTTYHNMTLWSTALFYDAPINKTRGTAISAYAGYFHYDFGQNYLRYNGIMNPSNGIVHAPFSGSQGNAYPMFGTGQIFYAQCGYLLKENLLGNSAGTLMPYVSWMHANYKLLLDNMDVFDIGVNWFIKAHSSKLTLDYQQRPVYQNTLEGLAKVDHRGQVTLQYQIFL